MQKLMKLLLLTVILGSVFVGCKKNDSSSEDQIEESHFKHDESAKKERKEKIKRAKDFYESKFNLAFKTESENFTLNWNKAGVGFVPNKGEAVLIPLEFNQNIEIKNTSTNQTFDREKVTKIWMYEKPNGSFSIQKVTTLEMSNGKGIYIINDLINNQESIAIEENGVTYRGSSSEGGTYTTYSHCEILGTFLNTYDQNGSLISSQLISTKTICEVTAVLWTSDDPGGGSGGGFDPNDDDNLELTNPYEWLVQSAYASAPPRHYTFEVYSYEEVTAKRVKGANNTLDWNLLSSSHSKSDMFSNYQSTWFKYTENQNTRNIVNKILFTSSTKGKIQGTVSDIKIDGNIVADKTALGFN